MSTRLPEDRILPVASALSQRTSTKQNFIKHVHVIGRGSYDFDTMMAKII
jgi:hypothetical protein